MAIIEKFNDLLENLRLENLESLADRFKTITKHVNTDFRNFPSDDGYSKLVGPVGRGTAIKTTNEIDMFIRLPGSLYKKYHPLPDGPNAMLKDVLKSIAKAYPSGNLTIENTVISVPFPDMTFKVTPVVQLDNGDYVCPCAGDHGTWQTATQLIEVETINEENRIHKRKVKDLARMAHAWRETWQVPISHLLLDAMIVNFLRSDVYEADLSFDQLFCDFLNYLASQDPDTFCWQTFGSNFSLQRSGEFETQAKESLNFARSAIELEQTGQMQEAVKEWQKIFGPYFPE